MSLGLVELSKIEELWKARREAVRAVICLKVKN